VWVNGEVVIGYGGSARAYLVRNGVLVELDLSRQRRSDGHEVHVGRIGLARADRLALMSSAVVGCVRHEELQSALLSDSSVEDAARSLVTLASTRADRIASALIAEFVLPPSGPQNPVRPPAPGRSWHQSHLLWLGLAVGMIIVILLLTAMLLRSSSKPHAARTIPPQAPTALRSQQVSATQVMFSWRAVPHATAYLLGVGLDQFYSRTPRATVSNILQPGRSYGWWVQSKLQSRMGPMSARTSLRLRPLPARSWRFYPLSRPVDQVLLTLYNPNTIAGDAQVQVRDAVSNRKQVHVAPHSGTEIGVLPSKAGNPGLALTVRASIPIVVQRVAIKANTTQSAYGIPEADAGGT
jgi:hypothetical protein